MQKRLLFVSERTVREAGPYKGKKKVHGRFFFSPSIKILERVWGKLLERSFPHSFLIMIL